MSIPTGPYYDVPISTFNVNITDSLICENLAIPQSQEIDFQIYPNPSNGQLMITTDQHQKGQVQIVDLQGKVILSEPLNSGQHYMDISDISTGLYIIRIGSESNWTSQKLILE